MNNKAERTATNTTATSPSDTPPSSPQKLRIGREIADTTWRMTIPVVIFAFIGIYSDIQLGTKPGLTFVGVVIGFYFAYILVKKQLERS